MSSYIEPALGLKNISEVLQENTLKRGKQFPYDGIWIFSGSQGSGKTLLLMHLVREMLEDFPEILIVSNISIFGVPCIPYKGIEDFEKYNNGSKGIVFIIDEIQNLFNSLESKNMPLSTMQVWSQNRKNRRVILGTSQRFTRVSKGVREQCLWNYECTRPLLSFLYSYRVYDGSSYDDKGNYIEELPPRRFYIPSVQTMRMYNTLEVVNRVDDST